MAVSNWFWYYEIKYWSEVKNEYTFPSGLVSGDTIVDAMNGLYQEYGDNIADVMTLKALTEKVFEFDEVNHNDDIPWWFERV